MRTKVKAAPPELALTRILEALGQELIDAPVEEIIEAAKDLRMDLRMKESAAFLGLLSPARPQLSDFFEADACRDLQAAAKRFAAVAAAEPKRKPRRSKRVAASTERKNPTGK